MTWLKTSEDVWALKAGLITVRIYSIDGLWLYKWFIHDVCVGPGPFTLIAFNEEQAKTEAIKGVFSVFKPLYQIMDKISS